MNYMESDNFSGLLESCYLNPSYHPACLGCMDRNECYGKEKYLRFRDKALIMSELLDNPDCLTFENAQNMAVALDIVDSLNKIQRVLTGGLCQDGKIWSIMKMSLRIPLD